MGEERTVAVLDPRPRRRDPWRATRWSIIQRLSTVEDPAWESSWAYLVDTYRAPMEAHARRVLSRVRGRDATQEEAHEAVGAFLAACFEKDWLPRADPLRGRFRAYVQTLLRRFIYAQVRDASAKKRSPGPGRRLVPLIEENLPEAASAAVRMEDEAFDRSWVQIAVDHALARLEKEHARYRLVIEDLIATNGESSSDLHERVGLRRAQLPVLKHRARRRFRALFEEELASTVADEDAFEAEWKVLQPYMP